MAMPVWVTDAARTSYLRFLGVPSTLITIQDEPIDVLEARAGRLLGDNRLLEASTAALTLDIVEAIKRALVRRTKGAVDELASVAASESWDNRVAMALDLISEKLEAQVGT